MNEKPHILVVDDDRRIRELLKFYLTSHDYLVTSAESALEARAKMRGLTFDLVILDVMMPGESGLSFITSLRSERQSIPVLMLSALSDPPDRIAGLSSGSDDYLSKPFEPQELLLRLQSLLRRRPINTPNAIVRFGECEFKIEIGEFTRSGNIVKLTTREKNILRLLSQRPGESLSRLQLAQTGGDEKERSVDVQINRLRQKIETDPSNPKYLQTIRSVGYALFIDHV